MGELRVEVDFDALARLVSDGMARLTAAGMVASWSNGAAAVTRIPSHEAVGRSLEELFVRIEPPLGFALTPEDVVLWGNDENRSAYHATVLTIDDGWLISFGRQRRYAEIEQLKSEIVTAVSHELKTPIATIKAYATTLLHNPESQSDLNEYLATIEEQADRLSSAVDDLLMVGRVGAEFMINHRETVPLDAIVQRIEKRLGPNAASRIRCEGGDAAFAGDPELLTLALLHLVENALKFSPESSPVILEGKRDRHGTSVRVSDRGVGIAEEHLPYIFERFYRVERNLTAATGGTGLGLFVASAIARAHGGSLAATSKMHEGSTFTLTIPVRG